MGRPPIGKIAMSGAERTRLYRLKLAAKRNGDADADLPGAGRRAPASSIVSTKYPPRQRPRRITRPPCMTRYSCFWNKWRVQQGKKLLPASRGSTGMKI
jgi:hypothetical protein